MRAALMVVFAIVVGLGAPLPDVPSFPVHAPDKPLVLKLSSPAIPQWGHTPPLRLVYYATDGRALNDVDRRTILRELQLIHDFYAHYGLMIQYEDRVYEMQGPIPADLPAEQHDYFFIKKQLEPRGLFVNRRTIVFATFDVGRGGGMALTGLNDATVRRLECPRPEKGYAWWCDRPEDAHWGGSVHEVGHMLGLSHPDEYTAEKPYKYEDGRTYVFSKADGPKAVMEQHDRFFRRADNGLLPHEIDLLFRRFHDSGAAPPAIVRGKS